MLLYSQSVAESVARGFVTTVHWVEQYLSENYFSATAEKSI